MSKNMKKETMICMNLGTIFPLQLQAVQARRVDLFLIELGGPFVHHAVSRTPGT